MKPKHLKYPFSWEERRPLIVDRIFFVPQYYNQYHNMPCLKWESEEIFGRVAPIQIEYCSGNGAWVIEKALKHPELNWVAVEKRFERVRKIWSKMHNMGLKNLFIVCGEALIFTHHYVPTHSIGALYVNFPDPWPKEKHAQHRLLKEPFLTEMARVSKSQGVLTIVTDHIDYKEQILHALCRHLEWSARFPDPFYLTDLEGYGSSYFDLLWREKGSTIHYMQFIRRELS